MIYKRKMHQLYMFVHNMFVVSHKNHEWISLILIFKLLKLLNVLLWQRWLESESTWNRYCMSTTIMSENYVVAANYDLHYEPSTLVPNQQTPLRTCLASNWKHGHMGRDVSLSHLNNMSVNKSRNILNQKPFLFFSFAATYLNILALDSWLIIWLLCTWLSHLWLTNLLISSWRSGADRAVARIIVEVWLSVSFLMQRCPATMLHTWNKTGLEGKINHESDIISAVNKSRGVSDAYL